MWTHAIPKLRCARCVGPLESRTDSFRSVEAAESHNYDGVEGWVESGALLCGKCLVIYPIILGVPILLTYATALSRRALESFPVSFREELTTRGFRLPHDEPPKGEEFVAASFSTEWLDYEYGETLWTAPLDDRIEAFRAECGLTNGQLAGKLYCEIGCGLGILTNEAAEGLGAEAWGVDLSAAIFRAAQQFKKNKNVHFVQASVFSLPFARSSIDFLYSHGVLHHTWSTREAVRHAASVIRTDGSMYVWLYGYSDVRISITRRLAFGIESAVRPILARLPGGVTTVLLSPLIPVYQFASYLGQRSGTHATRYTAQQALHAARDRFTPLFAHRHEVDEVMGWMKELGFATVDRVSGNAAPEAWKLAIERNVSVRANTRVAQQQAA